MNLLLTSTRTTRKIAICTSPTKSRTVANFCRPRRAVLSRSPPKTYLCNSIRISGFTLRPTSTLSSETKILGEPQKRWIDRVPLKVKPYLLLARLDKPIGTVLLFLPCTWSISMASYALQAPFTTPLFYISLFGIGAIIMRGAGCTINDLWDRNLDKAVERTKGRPLARGDLNVKQAFGFLALQLTAGLGVLTQLNNYSILLGASSLSIVAIYPFMKRVTYWPQAFLGLAFNWGALLGWSAVAGDVEWAVCLPLYAAGFCWTLVYDTIYAHQDKTDDITVDIRSTALLFGSNTRPILAGLSATTISLLAAAGVMNVQGIPYFAGVGIAGIQLARILYKTDFDSRESCWSGFVACGWSGFWVWMGAMGDYTYLLLSTSSLFPF